MLSVILQNPTKSNEMRKRNIGIGAKIGKWI